MAYTLTTFILQVITGIIQFVPTARYFPLRLHCVGLLHQVNECT
jgi:hypothetical protein